MRKGDERKQAILAASEKLFCLRGYHETSIQDILDMLRISKGSFYHHFESKEAVVITLCAQRAERACAACEEKLAAIQQPSDRLNAVLQAAMPIRQEETSFLAMLTPLLFTQEGRMVAYCYQDALRNAFLPLLDRELSAAMAAGVIFPPRQAMLADLVLTLVNRCWLHASDVMMQSIRTARTVNPADLDEELSLYRTSLERLVDAPFGSVELIRLPEWFSVAQALERRVHLPK